MSKTKSKTKSASKKPKRSPPADEQRRQTLDGLLAKLQAIGLPIDDPFGDLQSLSCDITTFCLLGQHFEMRYERQLARLTDDAREFVLQNYRSAVEYLSNATVHMDNIIDEFAAALRKEAA
jgi:hypothetical protein